MSFLPPGFVSGVELGRHHSAQLDFFGLDVTFLGAGMLVAGQVRVIRVDSSELAANSVMGLLVGFLPESGFNQSPQKNDQFTVNGVTFRAFDVQGPDENGAIYIHLTK